ncbi:hypothetical protein NL676_038376 [Syzygium grande]|nr:hypothetical protein NL676_038376 [Syzygium grande]
MDLRSFFYTRPNVSRYFHNRLTSRQLVNFYLDRIQALNPSLRCVLEVNPDAFDQADEADRAAGGGWRQQDPGGLHGIPVLLKDSIGTDDKMNTRAGSHAAAGGSRREGRIRGGEAEERRGCDLGQGEYEQVVLAPVLEDAQELVRSRWTGLGEGHKDVRHLVDECTCNCDMRVIESDSHRTGDMANANAAGGAPSPTWSKPVGGEAGGGLLGSGTGPPSREAPLGTCLFRAMTELFELPEETKRGFADAKRPYDGYVANLHFAPGYQAMGIGGVLDSPAIWDFTDLMWPDGNFITYN